MKLNEDVVKSLPVPESGNRITYFPDATLQGTETPPGFGVRVTANGVRSFVLSYRSDHVERRITIGQWPTWSVLKAVKEARLLRQRIDRGEDPLADRRKAVAASKDTLENIADEYFRRDGAKLRSKDRRERALKRLVYPVLGNRDISSIKRSQIVELLDDISDRNGPVMANRTKAYLSKVFNWHAIVRGMGYSSADEEARDRVLTDDEIRAVWKTAEALGTPFARWLQFILLTGARRSEALGMVRSELTDGIWLLPAERNKTGVPLARPLTRQALEALPAGTGPYVFSTNGEAAFGGIDKQLKAFRKASGTAGWTPHDLRRTARTLLSRAGISEDHSERCLGHVIGGVRAVYDHWKYLPEKKHAFEALAALIERIVDPPADNVMPLKRQAI